MRLKRLREDKTRRQCNIFSNSFWGWFLSLGILAGIGCLPAWSNPPGDRARFANPIVKAEKNGPKGWKASGSCSFEPAHDGKWSLAIDSTPTPGAGYDKWITQIIGIRPNTDYRISFDRMYHDLSGRSPGYHVFGRGLDIPKCGQPRIWERFSVQLNSGSHHGDVHFDIYHWHHRTKGWFRNFQIEAVQALPLEPGGGQVLDHTNPVLRWEAASDASFALQLSKDPDFPAERTRTVGPILDRDHWQVDPPLRSGRWYWRVAIASAALINPQEASYSQAKSFVVGEEATRVPSLETPRSITPMLAPRQIVVNKQGRLLVDKEPVFLIGLYCAMENREPVSEIDGSYMTLDNVASCEPLFKELVDAGFNTIQNYGTSHDGRTAETHAYLNLADRYGLWVLFEVQRESVQAMNKVRVEQEIREFAHHPSVLSWLLVDEGDMKGWSPVKARTMGDFIRAIDPSRVVGMVLRDRANYANTVDLMLPDPYTLSSTPTPQYELSKFLVGSQTAAGNALQPTVAVPILQAIKAEEMYEKLSDLTVGRNPSFDEVRCISYLAIAAGNQGVLYGFYHSSSNYMKDYPQHWENMKRLASELRERTPIFLGEKVDPPLKMSGEGLVSFARHHGDSTYLFVINPDVSPKQLTLLFNQEVMSVRLLEKSQDIAIPVRKFSATMRPFEVQTYRVQTRGTR